jgi:hypothetical protein
MIYEDIVYLSGGDISGDSLDEIEANDTADFYYRKGLHTGDIIVQVFAWPTDYEYPDITIAYPPEFDYVYPDLIKR